MPGIQRWKEATSPLQFEYSRDALEQIRQLAVEGLLMLPRVGIGVGGLLLGVREGERLRILDSVPIRCEHASGPAFTLSPQETAAAAEMVRTANPLSVVGCYASKTRGALALSTADEQLFQSLCPEPWQIAMLIRPSTSESSVCVFCCRDARGNIVAGDERPLLFEEPEVAEAVPAPVEQAAPAAGRPINKLALAAAILLIVAAAALLIVFR